MGAEQKELSLAEIVACGEKPPRLLSLGSTSYPCKVYETYSVKPGSAEKWLRGKGANPSFPQIGILESSLSLRDTAGEMHAIYHNMTLPDLSLLSTFPEIIAESVIGGDLNQEFVTLVHVGNEIADRGVLEKVHPVIKPVAENFASQVAQRLIAFINRIPDFEDLGPMKFFVLRAVAIPLLFEQPDINWSQLLANSKLDLNRLYMIVQTLLLPRLD